MKNHLHLHTIKQGLWIDTYQNILREKLTSFFQLPNQSQATIRITNHTVQRIALIAGLSIDSDRRQAVLNEVELKSTPYFDKIFQAEDWHPLITGLLKIHYHTLDIDWTNKIVLSKIINYEMEKGVQYLLKPKQLESFME